LRRLFTSLLTLIVILPQAILFSQIDYRERIISFDSEITINEDASMIVTEKINVYSNGDKIKRGIYRDFPTRYKDN